MQCGRPKFSLWVVKIPWRRIWKPTPVFLPGRSHGQRSLVGYSPGGHRRVRHDWVTEHSTRRWTGGAKRILRAVKHSVWCSNGVCCCCCLVAKSVFCDPMDYSPPGSFVHGISQTRILEWVAISISRRYSQSRDQIWVSCLAGRFSTTEPPGKPIMYIYLSKPIEYTIQRMNCNGNYECLVVVVSL